MKFLRLQNFPQNVQDSAEISEKQFAMLRIIHKISVTVMVSCRKSTKVEISLKRSHFADICWLLANSKSLGISILLILLLLVSLLILFNLANLLRAACEVSAAPRRTPSSARRSARLRNVFATFFPQRFRNIFAPFLQHELPYCIQICQHLLKSCITFLFSFENLYRTLANLDVQYSSLNNCRQTTRG